MKRDVQIRNTKTIRGLKVREVKINSVHVTKRAKKMVDSLDKKTNPAHKSLIS